MTGARRVALRVARTVTLLLMSAPIARAEDVEIKLTGLLQVWHTQGAQDSLRRNDLLVPPNRYYNLRPEFRENDFDVRRAEVKLTVKPLPQVAAEIMIDPSLGTATIGNILQDAALTLRPVPRLELKAGQFKTAQTYEGLLSSSALVFAERGQITRVFGDVRDRGALLSWSFGGEPALGGKLSVGAFNGGGRSADSNGSKDVVGRLEMKRGSQRFGAYGLRGHTDLSDGRAALSFAGDDSPAPPEVLANRDRTWHAGLFWILEGARWYASAEGLTGELGRRFPSLGLLGGPAFREHLHQRIAGVVLTVARTRGRHTLAARYDVADYNAGDRGYTSFDPYRESAPDTPRGADYTPRFTEVTLGYTFAWRADKPGAANVKLNYVARSKNFLRPRPGQIGAQGGDSLVLALQASF